MYQVNWKFKTILFLIDTIGYILFFPFRLFRREIKDSGIKKILVIRIDEIGDVLLTTPVFRALKKRFPKAEINVLMKSSTKELLENNPNVDNIIICKQPWLKKPINLFYYFSLIKGLRKLNFDLAVEMHPDTRNIFLGFLSAKYVIGHKFRGLGFLLDKATNSNPCNEHIIQLNLDVARLVGANSSDKLEVYYSKKNMENANKLIGNIKNKLICLNPGSGRDSKLWKNEKWAELADKLIEQYKAEIVFTGTSEERDLINGIQSMMKNRMLTRNLNGKTNLLDLVALIKKCRLLIATDSGPIHIARAVRTRAIGLYGAVNPRLWGYNEKYARSVCKAVKFEESKGKDMMELIHAEDVLREVKDLWGK